MEAVIVAGGLGSRLMPLTEHTPKHLLPVAGTPFVVHQIAKLAKAGVTHVVLATSYRAEQFEPVLGDGRTWGVRLTYVTEEQPLGTGGAIRNAAAALTSGPDDPVVILNGDILSGHDLAGQVAAHLGAGADVTLHLVEVPTPVPSARVPTDDSGRVTAFLEKSRDPSDQPDQRRLLRLPARRRRRDPRRTRGVGRTRDVPGAAGRGPLVQGYVDRGYWLDLGTPASLVRAPPTWSAASRRALPLT